MVNVRVLVALVALNLAGRCLAHDEDAQQIQLAPSKELPDGYACEHPSYKVHMFSKSPLVLYLEGFLTSEERRHLQDLAQGRFKHSAVLGSAGASTLHAVRTSQSTSVDRDALVRCVEERALDFQGFDTPAHRLEPIQLVKYAPTERYHFHTDWFTDPSAATASLGGNRVSSFFGYVKADNVTGGGTNFPLLDAPRDDRWCGLVECDDEYDNGVTFRPIEGNVIYWENLLPSGNGDQRTLHAGLPVIGGEKIGMNIWTRQAPLSADIRGE